MPILLDESIIDHHLDSHLHKAIAEDVKRDILATIPGLIYVAEGTPENIAYSINEYFHKYNKKFVLLSDYKEAPNAAHLLLQNKIVKLLYDTYGFTYDQLIYACGFLSTDENFLKLDKLFKENNLIPIKTINYVFFENEWAIITQSYPNVPAVRTKQNYKNKTRNFLYFTGAPRIQRWIMLGKLIENNLLDKTHYSVFEDKPFVLDHLVSALKRSKDHRLTKLILSTINSISKSPIEYPILLTCNPAVPMHQHMINDGDIDLFLDTHLSIIAETSYFKKDELHNENFWNFHGNFTFLTEKTFRAIAMLHPFILMARPFSLQGLRDMGYKTFSPYIDESYDTIIDDVDRLKAIYESISKLSKFSERQWAQFERNIFPIVIYNKEVLKKSTHRPVWMETILDKYSNARNNHTSKLLPNLISHRTFIPWATDTLFTVPGLNSRREMSSINIDNFAYTIVHYLSAFDKTSICFNDVPESFDPNFMQLINRVAIKLINEYNIDHKNIKFLCGATPTIENYHLYRKHTYNNGWLTLNCILYNSFEMKMKYYISREFDHDTTRLVDRPRHSIRPKIFTFLNGIPRVHRAYLLTYIIANNLLDKGYVSMHCSSNRFRDVISNNFTRKLYFKDLVDRYEKNNIDLPLLLTIDENEHRKQHMITEEDLKLFDTSYFTIIGETSYFKKISSNSTGEINYHLEGSFLTEKTFRAIACQHPFIMMSRPHTLKNLRKLGYKTFSPYIDESYDDIEDDDERLLKIAELIKSMCNKSPKFWAEFVEGTKDIAKHNFNVLMNAKETFFTQEDFLNSNPTNSAL